MANRYRSPNRGRTTPSGGSEPSLAQKRTRKRQILVLVVVGAMLLSTASAVLIAIFSDTTPPEEPPPVQEAEPARLWPEAGETLAGDVPCPEPGGDGERVTRMPDGPPVCIATTEEGEIDIGIDYMATIETSVGDLHYSLSTEHAPETINNFVVLARYGFFDGAPFDVITREGVAVTGGQFGDGSETGPGYELPSEAPPTGMIPTLGALAMLPTPDGSSAGGTLVLALGNNAADLPPETTFFGLLLDGSETVSAINRASGEDGQPLEEIVIEAVTVEQSEPT